MHFPEGQRAVLTAHLRGEIAVERERQHKRSQIKTSAEKEGGGGGGGGGEEEEVVDGEGEEEEQ